MEAAESGKAVGALAGVLRDYREGEISRLSAEHVEAWSAQVDPGDRPGVLLELIRVLRRLYFSRERVIFCLEQFLSRLVGPRNPATVFPFVRFLDIQTEGGSQQWLLGLVDRILQERYEWDLHRCGSAGPHTFIYLDDAVYTGNRLRYDLTPSTRDETPAWIARSAPEGCRLFIYMLGRHLSGWHYAMRAVAAEAAKKEVRIVPRCEVTLDNRRLPGSAAQFLWPRTAGDDPLVREYVEQVAAAAAAQRAWAAASLFRPAGTPPRERLFTSREARASVERAFLNAGAYLALAGARQRHLRPLGYEVLETLGFGTLLFTCRNIANNCPLALWWDQPGVWYPLLPRRVRE